MSEPIGRAVAATVVEEDDDNTTVRINRADGSTVDVLIPRPGTGYKDNCVVEATHRGEALGLNLVTDGHYS